MFFLFIKQSLLFFFFFNDTATTEIYTLSLHDALPIAAHAPWRVHAGRHAPRGREGRCAGCESGCGGAYGYAPRGPDEFAGEHFAHENAAAAGSGLGSADGGLAARVSSEACGCERERGAGNGAASRGILERESGGFSLPQQGRTYFRRRQRDDGLDRNPRLRLSRGERQQDPHRDDDV